MATIIDFPDRHPHSPGPGVVPTGGDRLFRALAALRAADHEGRRLMHREWGYVAGWFRGEAGRRRGAADACQYALMRVSRSIKSLRAQTPAEATSWLRRVLRTGFCDVYRQAKNEPVAAGLNGLSGDQRDRVLGRLRAPRAHREPPPEALDPWLGSVMDEVDEWLEGHVPSIIKRAGDRRRAEVALLRHVRKESLDDLRARLEEEVARDTLYKWFERGRDEVLLPTLEAWEARAELAEDQLAFVTTLQLVLLGTRREKSRKPRKGVS